MSEELIANYKIDMKENEKENLKLLFYFSHLFLVLVIALSPHFPWVEEMKVLEN